MTQPPPVAILLPLLVGTGAFFCTLFVHTLAVLATINLIRRQEKLRRLGTGLRVDLPIILQVVTIAGAAHFLEIALWAGLFMLCGEFHDFGIALYHSGVNYTTLGYGDLIMSPSWRALGPIEAADGSFMFGLSNAIAFAVVLRLIQARYADLRD